MSWDINLFNWIHGLAGWSVLTDALGIFLAKYLAYILGFAALVFIINQKSWREKLKVFIHLALAVLISRGILTEIIRYLYNRPRTLYRLRVFSACERERLLFSFGPRRLLLRIGLRNPFNQ